MPRKEGLLHNRLLSAIVIIALTVSALSLYKFSTETDKKAQSLVTPVNMAAIDSSSCVACHTDGNIIASMAVVSDASAHAAEGG